MHAHTVGPTRVSGRLTTLRVRTAARSSSFNWCRNGRSMTNPFNPEAGDTPAPDDAYDRELVERSAVIIWRAFPYFAWRYGERGRSFGRSDAGFLVTLLQLDERTGRQQVEWLVGVLAPRGMPSLLLEYQLESLGKLGIRNQRPQYGRFLALASEMRALRLSVLEESVFAACEQLCRNVPGDRPNRRGVGTLIAAAVADRSLGQGEHDESLVQWLSASEQASVPWAVACAAALDRARTHSRPVAGVQE